MKDFQKQSINFDNFCKTVLVRGVNRAEGSRQSHCTVPRSVFPSVFHLLSSPYVELGE